jgi:hypothetical protein
MTTTSRRREATEYLKKVYNFLKINGANDAKLYIKGADYFEFVGYGSKSFGGITFEGSLALPHGDDLAELVTWEQLPPAPKGLYFEPSTSWAIALYEA